MRVVKGVLNMSATKEKLLALLRLPRKKRIYLISFFLLLLCSIFVGLDNPTGIILGWLAITVLAIALVRSWRKPWYFLVLLAVSIIGAIILSGIYVEVAWPLASWIGGVNVTESAGWRVFHVIVSNLILLVTPVGIIVGLGGFIILCIWRLYERRHRRDAASST
jgi:MFS family permease